MNRLLSRCSFRLSIGVVLVISKARYHAVAHSDDCKVSNYHHATKGIQATEAVLSCQPTFAGIMYNNIHECAVGLYHNTVRLMNTLMRTGYLSVLLSPVMFTFPALLVMDLFSVEKTNFDAPFQKWWWDNLKYSLRLSGPCLTKFSQWIATRPDIIPQAYCVQLQELQHNATIHSWEQSVDVLWSSFGPQTTDQHGRSPRDDLSIPRREKEAYVRDILGLTKDSPVLGSGCVAQVLLGSVDISGYGASSNPPTLYSNTLAIGEATEKPDGHHSRSPVAIKILHPGVEEAIKIDVSILYTVGWLLENCLPYVHTLSICESINEFSQSMNSQLNLENEAKALDKFKRNFPRDANTTTAFISFPTPLWPFVTHKVLVESYEPGILLNKILHAPTQEAVSCGDVDDVYNLSSRERKELAKVLFDGLLKMVFVDNLTHGDMHPGNIILRRKYTHESTREQVSGSPVPGAPVPFTSTAAPHLAPSGNAIPDSKPRPFQWELVLIDAGIVAELSVNDKLNIFQLFKSVVGNHGAEAGRLMVERQRFQPASSPALGTEISSPSMAVIDADGFYLEMCSLVKDLHSHGLSLRRQSVGSILDRVMYLCMKHHVKLESKFVQVVVAVGIVEGVSRALDPDLDIFLAAAPYFMKAALNESSKSLLSAKVVNSNS